MKILMKYKRNFQYISFFAFCKVRAKIYLRKRVIAMENESKNTTGILKWLIVTGLAAAAVAVILFVLLWGKNKPLETDPARVGYVASADLTKADPDNPQTQAPGYAEITLDRVSKKLNIPLSNPEGNSCYFVIHLVVDGKDIYSTKMLPPGKSLEEVRVDKKLKKGTYDAVLRYECFHVTSLTRLNEVEVKTKLVVQ